MHDFLWECYILESAHNFHAYLKQLLKIVREEEILTVVLKLSKRLNTWT